VEFFSKRGLVKTAREMWNAAKQNGLDPELVKEVEEGWKRK
jgi:hypothetical protein